MAKEKVQKMTGRMDLARAELDATRERVAIQETNRIVETTPVSEEAAAEAAVASQPPPAPERPPSLKLERTLPPPPQQTFLDKIEEQPARRVVTAVPMVDEESPMSAADITPKKNEPLPQAAKRKLLDIPKFFFGKSRREAHEKRYEATPLTDGDAIYKVAISDGKVTAEEAVEIGLAKNAKLTAAKKNIEVMDAKLMEAKRALFPTLQGELVINGGKVPAQVEGHRIYRGESMKLNMTQPLYYGGELTNTVKQAEENIRVAKAEYAKAKDDHIHSIRVAYYGVIKAEYNTEYQLELYEKINAVLKKVKAQRDSKVAAEIDYLNVESQYYQALYQVESAKNDVLSANVSLKQSMNVDVEGTIPVDLKMNFVKIASTFDELVNRAVDRNADIRVKAYAVEAAKYGIDIYESKKKPHFELRGSWGKGHEAFKDTQALEDDEHIIDPEKEWFLGVTGSMPLGAHSLEYEQIKHVYAPSVLALTGTEDWKHVAKMNLFDKFGNITDEKLAEYALLQAESEYKDVKDEVTLRLRDEYYALQRYLIQIDSSIAKLRYQNKQIDILEYLLNIQETSPSNYIENLIAQVQDRYAFIQAIADYNVTLSTIGLLIGEPYYFDNQKALNDEFQAAGTPEAGTPQSQSTQA